jgi:hypothetical protein
MNATLQRQIVGKVALAQQEEWLSTQVGVDSTTMAILAGKGAGLSPPRHVKIIGIASRSLCCSNLFRAMKGKRAVHSLSLVGVHVDEDSAVQLFEALQDSKTKLRVLQLWRLNMGCLSTLYQAFRKNSTLKETRLTFHGDLNQAQSSELMAALQTNRSISRIKLFGVDLSHHAPEIEALIRDRPHTKELRLTRCRISNASFLAFAVAASKELRILDLSMNEICCETDVATMLKSTSLKNTLSRKKSNWIK